MYECLSCVSGVVQKDSNAYLSLPYSLTACRGGSLCSHDLTRSLTTQSAPVRF